MLPRVAISQLLSTEFHDDYLCVAIISEDLTNDTHSLAHVVEVQYGQKLVGDGSSHLTQRDGFWGSRPEDKPKVSRRSDQRSLIR